MKRNILYFFTILFSFWGSVLKAQCNGGYGIVHLDTYATAGGASTFNITTAHPNELILISLNGYDGPSFPTCTVDGNAATNITEAYGQGEEADVASYFAPYTGTHTIVVNENVYSSPYFMNFAAAFYVTGTCQLSNASLVSVQASFYSTSYTQTITTTVPNEMIYSSFCVGYHGNTFPYSLNVTGATVLETLNECCSIDAAEAYTNAPVAGTYSIISTDNNGPYGATVLVAIVPTACSPPMSAGAINVNPICNCNGTINIHVNGGSTPYTYSWTSNVSTSNTATGLCPGSYTCQVHDAVCHDTIIVDSLSTAAVLLDSANAQSNELCHGQCIGSALVSAKGGISPYTYSWAPVAASGSVITGLCAGIYTITVTDANRCQSIDSVTITQPAVLFANGGTPTNVSCFGGSNGRADVTATGGTPVYGYSWTPVSGTGPHLTGLTAGSYTVKVTDASGCTATTGITLYQPPLLTVSILTQTNLLCNGGNYGSAIVTANGGTLPYTYSWSPISNNSAVATGLEAGTYSVTVEDANGCAANITVGITQPPVLTATIGAPANIFCNGGSNGSATVTASGGTPGYIYSWKPNGGINAMGTGLSVGTYTVKVTDAHGCVATSSVTLTQPPVLNVTTTINANIVCNGDTSVIVNAGVNGGISPYLYSWTPIGGTSLNSNPLPAGTYTFTATDFNNCSAGASVNITQPAPVNITINSVSEAHCYGFTGSISANNATGGNTPYRYFWAPTGGTHTQANGLTAGSYTIIAIDSHGCLSTASAIVTQPTQLSVVNAQLAAVSCYGGSNGSVSATSSGGTLPYTYLWSVGATTAIVSGLSAGSYSLTLTDKNGCSVSSSLTVMQPNILGATIIITSAIYCNGGSATINAVASGGTNPYTYQWSNLQTTSSISGLSAGTYSVSITDSCGDLENASITITQPNPLLISVGAQNNVPCNGGTGSVTADSAIGGTSPYNYNWSPSGGTNITASGLSAGVYTITVKDAHGCTSDATAAITQPAPLLIAGVQLTDVSCYTGSNGSAAPTVSGGTNPFTYSWSNTQTTANINGLTAGSYSILIADIHGCSTMSSITITQPLLLSVAANQLSEVYCNGASSGMAGSTASGGTAPYSYQWTNGGSTSIVSGLSAGIYTVTLTDNNGCTSSSATTINQISALSVKRDSVDDRGLCSGLAAVTISGGTSPYLYQWLPGEQTTDTIKGICAGIYCCTVTDNDDCQKNICITVKTTVGVEMIQESSSEWSVYPDPNTGHFTIQSVGTQNFVSTQWSVEIYNVLGEKVYSAYLPQTPKGALSEIDLSDQANGLYLIRILNKDGSLAAQKKIVKTD